MKVLAFLVILLAGIAIFVATYVLSGHVLGTGSTGTASAPPPAPPAAAPTAPAVAAAPTARPAAVSTAAPGEVAVVLDEATLTQQANASLAGQPLTGTPLGTATLRNLSVQLRNGQIQASGTAQAGPTNLPISITATPEAQAGRLRVTVTDGRIGGLPMPASLRQYVQDSLQEQVDHALAGQRVRVRAVTVADGRMTVVGARV